MASRPIAHYENVIVYPEADFDIYQSRMADIDTAVTGIDPEARVHSVHMGMDQGTFGILYVLEWFPEREGMSR